MKRILLGMTLIGVIAGGAIFAGTTAFFSDTETSTDNVFQAGALDLKVDSECHYYHYDPDNPDAIDDENSVLLGYVDVGCATEDDEGNPVGTWEETDLGVHKFFWFNDLKPGDRGEDTVSLHVYDNDAWGRFSVVATADDDVSSTEPELEVEGEVEDDPNDFFDGELGNALAFNVWLDEGSIPGFQCGNPAIGTEDGPPVCEDPFEGDNLLNGNEVLLTTPGPVGIDEENNTENYNLWPILQAAYTAHNCAGEEVVDGQNNYSICHGLAADGRMVASTTYYFGVEWMLPAETGNVVQTDRFVADMSFEVEQHRNNPTPFGE